MENKFSINRNEIPENLQEFQEGLEKIFGTGAQFIEILIMKNLHAKIGCPRLTVKNKKLEFIEYLDASKQGYLGNVQNQRALLKANPASFLLFQFSRFLSPSFDRFVPHYSCSE
jgi:hypothetical protein